MESVSNVSSEEELLQLRNEGRISKAEYGELLNAMHAQSSKAMETAIPDDFKNASKQKFGKLAFYLMLAGILLPILSFFISFAISGGGEGDVIFSVCFFLFVLIEIPAFVFGMISWPDAYGKATIITNSIIALLTILLVLYPVMSKIQHNRQLGARQLSTMIETTELKSYPLDNMKGLITQSGISIDKQISRDGNGSLRIEATEPSIIRLFETGDIDIENARLFYQAKLRTEKVLGKVYLEMWCHFPGGGEFFSKGLSQANTLTGTTDWTTEEIPFLLNDGENPDNVRLNLAINGKGTVWIDDIRLLKGVLP